MDKRFKKGIKAIRQIKLTTDEKKSILEAIGVKANTRFDMLQTPYFTVFDYWKITKKYVYVPALSLGVLLIGGTIAHSAEGSIPGDIFYPIKISVTEPIRDKLALSESAKVDWQIKKIDRRLSEVKALVLENKVDEKKKEEILRNFSDSVDAFHNADKILKDENTGIASEKEKELISVVTSHIRYLEELEGEEIEASFAEESVEGVIESTHEDETVQDSSLSSTTQIIKMAAPDDEEKDTEDKGSNEANKTASSTEMSKANERVSERLNSSIEKRNQLDGSDKNLRKENKSRSELANKLRDSIVKKAYETINNLPSR